MRYFLQSICPNCQPEYNSRLSLSTKLPHLQTSTIITNANRSSHNDNMQQFLAYNWFKLGTIKATVKFI